jgi:hypothetical protein
MVSIPKVVGVMSCGFLLCLGLSHAAQAGNAASAADEMNAGQSSDKRNEKGQTEMGAQDTLKGDEMKARRSDRKGGQADQKKRGGQMKGSHSEGDKTIEGDSAQSTDRRNEKTESMPAQ